MPLKHKYLVHDFGNGFQTNNSILNKVPYDPEVIFIGTFNHGWSWNQSDFFYGRGMYMWPILANLFIHGQNNLINQRTINNNEPTKEQIFEICQKGRIVFADIVKGIKDEIHSVKLENENCILVNNEYRWETRSVFNKRIGEYSDAHLDNLGENNWLDDNVNEIIRYINNTRSIKYIYFTFKSGHWIVRKLNEIKKGIRPDVKSCSIFTPTGNGFLKNIEQPFQERTWGITHCWVWNGLKHSVPIYRPDYGHLDHYWLRSKGINPDNF